MKFYVVPHEKGLISVDKPSSMQTCDSAFIKHHTFCDLTDETLLQLLSIAMLIRDWQKNLFKTTTTS